MRGKVGAERSGIVSSILMSRVALVTGSSGGIGGAIRDRPTDDCIDVLGEVADVVSFLSGPGKRTFTGTAVTMDMGWTAR